MRRRLFQGLVLSALVAGSAAWVRLDKTVAVEIDGRPVAVRTYAGTVGGVLAQMSFHPGSHDLVAPAPEVKVKEGSRIVVRRGRQVALRLNGKTQTVWVTALSVDEALAQLAVRDAGHAFVSASRSRTIPLSGLALEVRTPARVTIAADGKVRTVVTTAPTVRDLLRQARLRLARTDKLSVPLGILPLDGLSIRVVRIRGTRENDSVAIPYASEQHPDPSMFLGQSRVTTRGIPGVRVLSYALTYTDRRLTGRRLVGNKVLRKPVTEVRYYGTRHRTVDDLNWYALARCESGNNPRAVSSGGTYRGLYQFRMSTWRGVGGVGDPIDASRDEQTYRAKRLYLRSGRGPWPYCGRFL